jgi:YD repeat-containing protein
MALLSVIAILGLPSNAHAAVVGGRIPGTFKVDFHTGAATYSIPIWVQPAPRGMQPALALSYNSHGGNSPLGLGWSVSGLSAITRCTQTVAQDGIPAPITLTYADRFCLDGQRLRLTSSENLSTYGQDGTMYQTEVANFSRVTAHGSAGNGPSYFTVQSKDGLTYEYGQTSVSFDSQVLASGTSTVLEWLLSSVTDRNGNGIHYIYLPKTGAAVLSAVTYSGPTSKQYKVLFGYSPNNTVSQSATYAYVGGTPIVNTSLLTSIEIDNGITPVKKYIFAYTYSTTTGRALLQSVKECTDSTQSNCLTNSTSFEYQATGAAGVSGSTTTAVSTSPGAPGASLFAQYDFDGDGKADVIYYQGGLWYIQFQTTGGYGPPVNTGITDAGAMFGDVLGAAQDGILARNGSTFYFYQYDGIAFNGNPTSVPVDSTAQQYVLADITGDGLPDLVKLSVRGAQYSVTTQANSTASGVISFAAEARAYVGTWASTLAPKLLTSAGRNDGQLKFLDFNGDGRQDLFIKVPVGTASANIVELVSNGAGMAFTAGLSVNATGTNPILFPVNWNDDACTDFYLAGTIYLSGCNGSAPLQLTTSTTVVAAMDWDGDGRTDLLAPNGTTLAVYRSLGNAVATMQPTSVPYSASYDYLVWDANADAQDDLAYVDNSNSSHPVAYWAHNNTVGPDLLTYVYDTANNIIVTHKPLLNTSYVNTLTTATGYKSFLGPSSVVTSVTFPDNSTTFGQYVQTYRYKNAWMSLQGRGFTGFGAIYVTDSRKGTMQLLQYGREFPYTGMPAGIDLYQDNTFFYPVSQRGFTFGLRTLDSTVNNQRYFPYVSQDTIDLYEVGGTKNAQDMSTTTTNYAFDAFGNATNVATTVTDNDIGSPYQSLTWSTTTATVVTPDASANWCLNLPTNVQVTKTAPGANAVTRTMDFTPDYVKCREMAQVTEPGNATYQVTETFAFDSFGNISKDTVTGAGMGAASPATRITQVDWGTMGIFPMKVTDPSGAITQHTYDWNFGVPLTKTDSNNLVTTWQYTDGFGRKTKETRPDKTNTQWVYADCRVPGCLMTQGGVDVQETIYNADNSVQASNIHFFDPEDRWLMSQTQAVANNTYNRQEIRYDSFGHIAQRFMPCSYTAALTPCPYQSTTLYDVRNRPYQMQRPVSQQNPALQTTMISYQGDTTVTTDPQMNASTTVSTPTGMVGQVIGASGYVQTFVHDGFGSLLSVTDNHSATLLSATYDYGIGPFQRDVTDMDLDVSTAAGQHRHYTYTALGELINWSDAKGQSFSMTYDAVSRPLTRTEPGLSTTWTWGNSPANHNVGQLVSLAAGTYADAYTFDAVARPATRTYAGSTFNYTYNTMGLLDTLTYPTSTSAYRLKLQYVYQNGYLQQVKDFNAGTPFWTRNSTNPWGQITQETLGNGVVTNRSFDAVTGWLSLNQAGMGGGTGLQNHSYLYDMVGNLTQRQNNALGLSESFCYDTVYRLDHSTLTGLCSGPPNLQMGYDATGNVSSRSDVAGGAVWTYSSTHRHQVLRAGDAAHTYTYDPNGNVSTRNGYTISWTSFNYPSTLNAPGETSIFTYGPHRDKVKQVYTGSTGTETTNYWLAARTGGYECRKRFSALYFRRR